MFNEDDFEAYYDGELALRPFFRAYFRDRWMRLRAFIKYRVLRRPRPVRGAGGCASLVTMAEMYKRVYTPERVADAAARPALPFATIAKGESTSWTMATPRPDFDAKDKE